MRHPFFSRICILIAASLIQISQVWAADKLEQLAGRWIQIDEKSGKTQSLIRIVEIAPNRYEGFVEKIYAAPGEDPNPRCEDCKGARKNQPVIGMRIITNLKRAGSTNDFFDGGEIFDPDTGDTYRLKIALLNAGKKLDVRGYIGISLFGRSQIWVRETGQ
jgi:uncharacterized protein (DUF2147 family)